MHRGMVVGVHRSQIPQGALILNWKWTAKMKTLLKICISCHHWKRLYSWTLVKRKKTWLDWFVIGIGNQYRASVQRYWQSEALLLDQIHHSTSLRLSYCGALGRITCKTPKSYYNQYTIYVQKEKMSWKFFSLFEIKPSVTLGRPACFLHRISSHHLRYRPP